MNYLYSGSTNWEGAASSVIRGALSGVRCITSFVSKRKKRGYEFRNMLGNYTMKRTNPPNSYPRFLRL